MFNYFYLRRPTVFYVKTPYILFLNWIEGLFHIIDGLVILCTFGIFGSSFAIRIGEQRVRIGIEVAKMNRRNGETHSV